MPGFCSRRSVPFSLYAPKQVANYFGTKYSLIRQRHMFDRTLLKLALDCDEESLASALLEKTGCGACLWLSRNDELVSVSLKHPVTLEILEDTAEALRSRLEEWDCPGIPEVVDLDLDESASFAPEPIPYESRFVKVEEGDRVVGGYALLEFPEEEGGGTGSAQEEVTEFFSSLFAVSFKLRRSQRRVDRAAGRLEEVAEVGKVFAEVGEPERTIHRILDLAKQASGAEVGAVVRALSEENFVVTGLPREVLERIRFGNGRNLIEVALQSDETRVFDRGYLASNLEPDSSGIILENVILVPLEYEAQRLGALVLFNLPPDQVTDGLNLATVGTMARLAASALTSEIRQAERLEQERTKQELKAAFTIQQGLLPKEFPEFSGVTIAAVSRPSRSVGGDFYDTFSIGENLLGILIADVSGKGIPAGLLMATARAYMRILAMRHPDSPARCLEELNDQLVKEIADNKFITANYVIVDLERKKVTSANAGHHEVLIVSDQGTEAVESGGLPLGILEGTEYEDVAAEVKGGDKIVLFTDGLIEVRNGEGTLLGTDGLKQILSSMKKAPPGGLLESLWEETIAFSASGEPDDDWTVVIVEVR
ncbi:MAG: hypothetical protein D6679_09575 [Candidatus Hydrogenedentota bacterium]|nr:MAG: hypothetical protein D6679_09575 [Candidatus Hydrogenedentota bacterium]